MPNFTDEIDAVIAEAEKRGIGNPMTVTKTYNKFQISKMFGDYQIVLRTDSAQEMLEALRDAEPIMSGIEKKIAGNKPSTSTGMQTICPIHNVSMEEKDGQYGPYFSHKAQEGWCNGKKITPFKKGY